MIDGVGEIDGVLVLGRRRQPKNLGVIFGLLFEVWHLVAGMRDLANPDHFFLPCDFFDFFAAFFLLFAALLFDVLRCFALFARAPRGMPLITSTMMALSCSPSPWSMQSW